MDEQLSLQRIVGKGYAGFWKTRKRYRMVKGGRGSKKSTTTAIWYVKDMMQHNLSNLLVIRKVYKDHKDSTYAQLKWAINRLNVRSQWEPRLSPLEIIHKPTGQKILFRGLDDPLALTSMTVEHGFLNFAWFEELYQINAETDFNKVDMSIRGELPPGYYKQITGTFNPWNEKHWLKKRFFDKDDPDTFALTTTYMCNEFLGQDDIALFEKMKREEPRRYRVEGLGEWGMADGLIFDNWEEREFDYRQILLERPHARTGFGLDFGYTNDPTALTCEIIDEVAKEIYIFDEHSQRGMLNNQIADMLKYKGYAKERIIADAAEPKSIEEIRRYGIPRIMAAQKGKDSLINGIQYLQQFKIIVHPRCTGTILELSNYAWDTRYGSLINKPIDSFNHNIDAMRYGAERKSNPKVSSSLI